MARPQKNNADYHSHDKDMRNDPKIKAIRRRFKHEGYSIYNMVLELLDDAEGFTLKYNDLNIELWAGDFEIEPDTLRQIFEYSIHIGLFVLLDDDLYSEGHIKRMTGLLDKRNKKRESLAKLKSSTYEVSDENNPQSKVKESKVKESKVKESKVNNSIVKNIKKEDSFSPKGEPVQSVYAKFITVYDSFIKKRTNCPAKIDGQQGKAAKAIIAYLQAASTEKSDEGVLYSWEYILSKWDSLEAYYQGKLKLSEISSNIVNIIGQIKNGKSKKGASINSQRLDEFFTANAEENRKQA